MATSKKSSKTAKKAAKNENAQYHTPNYCALVKVPPRVFAPEVGREREAMIDISSSPDERSMNFGWDISDEVDTAIHEIGHTLGAPHEHQNPNAGIVWDEEAVYNALAQPPNSWNQG